MKSLLSEVVSKRSVINEEPKSLKKVRVEDTPLPRADNEFDPSGWSPTQFNAVK